MYANMVWIAIWNISSLKILFIDGQLVLQINWEVEYCIWPRHIDVRVLITPYWRLVVAFSCVWVVFRPLFFFLIIADENFGVWVVFCDFKCQSERPENCFFQTATYGCARKAVKTQDYNRIKKKISILIS